MHAPRSRAILFALALALALLGIVPTVVAATDPARHILASFPGMKVSTLATQSKVEVPLVRPVDMSDPADASATATADIQVTYHGFSSAAQAVFEAAVTEWEQHVVSSRVINVDATWAPLGAGVLGAAGPQAFYLLGDGYVYPAALAEAICNCERGDPVEIEATFNSAFTSWYLGTDGNVPSNKWDFYSVVLHELGHGLGFLSSFGVSGSYGGWGFSDGVNTYPLRFDINEWSALTGGRQLTDTAWFANPSTSLKTQLTDGGVYFGGSNVVATLGARAKLYAPSTWQPGSSNSHFDEAEYPQGSANGLMTPALTNGEVQHEPGALTLAVFRDIGWQTNDAPPPPQVTVSVGDAVATEGDDAAWFLFTLSEAINKTITVNFATQNGTAVAPGDYQAVSSGIEFQPYQTTALFLIGIVDDVLDEPDESFSVDLADPVNATIADGHGVGTIIDNDGISITDVQPDEAAGTADLVVSLSAPMGAPVTVHYETVDQTATAPADYTAISGTLTFEPGTTSLPLSVVIVDDSLFEGDEGFGVDLTNPTNMTIHKHWGGVEIKDNDVPASPTLLVTDAWADENGHPLFELRLEPASDQWVEVDYTTADGTAVAYLDYGPTSGRARFGPGETLKTIYIELYDDSLDEANETFVMNLSNPSNATIFDAQGTAAIHDNDVPPLLSIGDVSVNEDAGQADFTVSLSAASGQVVSISYATANGTATAPADFTAWNGPLTFNPGQTSQTVSIPIINDTVDEPDETFTVNLASPTNATLDDVQATGTIVDEDEPPPPPGATISIADASVKEGSRRYYTVNLVFVVTLSQKVTGPVTVRFVTANGTAVAGSDYIAKSGLLTWTKRQIKRGKLAKSLIIKVKCDRLVEANETVLVILSGPTNATIVDGQATGTIVNDD